MFVFWTSYKHQVPVEQLSAIHRSKQANKRRAARKFDRENRKDPTSGKEYESVVHRWHEDEEFQKQMSKIGLDKLALERIVADSQIPPKFAPMSRHDRQNMVDTRGQFIADRRRARQEENDDAGRSRQKTDGDNGES